jgi:DHA2 family multidrug resistance protein
MNVARNLGGTIGIATVETLLARRQQFHQSRLVETLNPLNPNYTSGIGHIAHQLVSHGQLAAAAPAQGLAQFYGAMQRQAAMLSYVDVFHTLMIVVFASIPLLALMRGTRPPSTGRSSG